MLRAVLVGMLREAAERLPRNSSSSWPQPNAGANCLYRYGLGV